MMLTVIAAFTKTVGVPATGLTLAEINLYLTAIAKATGVQTVIWDGSQHPTAEITSLGMYLRQYTGEDVNTYEYVAGAHYTGATTLDSDWITAAFGEDTQVIRDAMKLAPTAGSPAAGSVDDHLDDIQAKTDLISAAGAVTVTSPVASDGDVDVYQGDDYANADSRALEWTNAAGRWPDLTSATVKLVVRGPDGTLVQVTGSVVTPTGAGQKVRVELTAAQTALLEEWPNASELRVIVWLSPSGRRVTLVDSELASVEDLLD